MKAHSRYLIARRFLIFWTFFIGIGALFGSTCMFLKPDGSLMGMQGLLPYFQVLPFADILFQNYIFPGISLLIVNGISNIAAGILLLQNKKLGIYLGGVFGITLMAWIMIQFIIFPMNFMDIAYFLFGLSQALTGYIAYIFYTQEHFSFHKEEYSKIGTHPSSLVVYFSRMGYTKKIAYEIADKSGACIYELQTSENTEGTLGFWWCGRFGMHRWDMELVDMPDVSAYEHITIVSPIWVFKMACPIRSFCKKAAGKIKAYDIVLVHHMHCSFKSTAEEMDTLIQCKHTNFRSIRNHIGKMKEIA